MFYHYYFRRFCEVMLLLTCLILLLAPRVCLFPACSSLACSVWLFLTWLFAPLACYSLACLLLLLDCNLLDWLLLACLLLTCLLLVFDWLLLTCSSCLLAPSSPAACCLIAYSSLDPRASCHDFCLLSLTHTCVSTSVTIHEPYYLFFVCLLPNTFICTHASPFTTIWAHPCPYVPSLCAAVFWGFPSVTDHHTYAYCDRLCLTLLLCCCDPPYFRPPLDSSDPSAPTHDPPCSFVCVCNTMYDFY